MKMLVELFDGLKHEVIQDIQSQIAEVTRSELRKATEDYSFLPIRLESNGKVVDVEGLKHSAFGDVVTALNTGLCLFLVGPAGSGKTYLVEQAAQALGKEFYCISVCAQTTASSLVGYMDATGKYVRTLFREAFEKGGVFLLDEIDNGNPNVLSILNAAMSNHYCAFPDGMVKKHPDFIMCASGNTYGLGADRMYVGRLEIDAATLDRFVFLEIGYDKSLEYKMTGLDAWTDYVVKVRQKIESLKMRHIISPRASVMGAKMLRNGFELGVVIKTLIVKGMSKDEESKAEIFKTSGDMDLPIRIKASLEKEKQRAA